MPRSKRPVIIFREIDLKYITITETVADAALIACGDKRKNGNVLKYLNGEINELYGLVFIAIEQFIKEPTERDIENWRSQARIRKVRALFTRMTASFVENISIEDVKKLGLILNKYNLNILAKDVSRV